MQRHRLISIFLVIIFLKLMETEGNYTKVDTGIVKGIPSGTQIGDCTNKHKVTPWNNVLWFFGTKPVVNPSREGGLNYECFQGGYLAKMQPAQQGASAPTWTFSSFPPVVDYNYAQDFIFGLQDQIFMFVYSRFDGFYFYGLYYWCDNDRKWKDASMQKHGDYAMNRDVDCSAVQCSPLDQSVSYVVVMGRTSDHMKVYQFKRDTTWPNYVDMNTLCSIDNATGFSNPHLLVAAVRDKTIYCLVGTALPGGKVTSWDQTQVVIISLEDCRTEVKTVKGHGETIIFPPFPFGPTFTVHDGNAKWIMVGGFVSEEAYSRDVWILDLDQLEWIRTCHAFPDDLETSELAATQLNGQMYVADKNNAVYSYPLEYMT